MNFYLLGLQLREVDLFRFFFSGFKHNHNARLDGWVPRWKVRNIAHVRGGCGWFTIYLIDVTNNVLQAR